MEKTMTVDISTIPCTNNKAAHAVASFLFQDYHRLVLRSDKSVTCGTCSIPKTAAAAIVFMYENGVINLTVDGAPIKRV
jgi:ferredoxin-like protein FixX